MHALQPFLPFSHRNLHFSTCPVGCSSIHLTPLSFLSHCTKKGATWGQQHWKRNPGIEMDTAHFVVLLPNLLQYIPVPYPSCRHPHSPSTMLQLSGCPIWEGAWVSLPCLLQQPALEWQHRQPPCLNSPSCLSIWVELLEKVGKGRLQPSWCFLFCHHSFLLWFIGWLFICLYMLFLSILFYNFYIPFALDISSAQEQTNKQI